MADNELELKVGGDAGGATDALKDVGQGVKDLKDQISQVSEGVKSFKDAFISAFTVEKVFEFIEAMTSAATQVERLTTALGVTSAVVDSFDVMGRAAGTSVSAISEGMTRLEMTISRAAGGVTRASDALANLGLKAKDFAGLDTTGKLDLLSEKLSVLRDGSVKTAIAQQLLGGAASALLPIMNRGAGAMAEYADVTRRASSEATPAFLAEMSRLDLALIESSKSLSGFGQAVITAFAPALSGLAGIFNNLIQAMTNSIKEGGTFAALLNGLAISAQVFATGLMVGVAAIQTLWEVTKTTVFVIGQAFMSLGNVIKDVFTFNFNQAKIDFADLGAQLTARAKITADNMGDVMRGVTSTLRTIWNEAATDHVKADQNADAIMRRTNQDAIAAAMSRYNTEVQLAKQALAQKASVLDMEVALGRITQNTKFAQLQKYTEDAYQAELSALQAESRISGLKLAQQQEIFNKIKLLKSQHEVEMTNLDKQSLQAQIANYRQYTDAVAGAFNAQLQGLLTGQLSFAQAAKNILLQLSIQTIELMVTKPLAAYVAGKLAELTATQSGAAAKAAAEVAGAEAALPAKIASFTSDLTARAALTFAGIMANLSPILGPAAAGPAAAGEGLVMAQMAAVPKFDVGAWSVPRTGLAVVHQNEAILPAGAPADAYRAGMSGGGGGSPMQIIIQAWDGASVDSWLKSGGSAKMAGAVATYQDKNPSTRNRR